MELLLVLIQLEVTAGNNNKSQKSKLNKSQCSYI